MKKPWFIRFANWIEKNGGMREIYRPDPVTGLPVVYMKRYYIAKTPWFEIMIHQFFKSDLGGLHDHPWPSFGWILNIGYREHVCNGIVDNEPVNQHVLERVAGNFSYRPAANKEHSDYRGFHKVELRPGTEGNVWTLFCTGKRIKIPYDISWGFLEKKRWVPNAEQFELDGTNKIQANYSTFKGWIFPRKVVKA